MHQDQWVARGITPLETVQPQALHIDETMARCGHGLEPIDGNFDEVGFFGRPCEGAHDSHRTIVN